MKSYELAVLALYDFNVICKIHGLVGGNSLFIGVGLCVVAWCFFEGCLVIGHLVAQDPANRRIRCGVVRLSSLEV